MPKGIGLTVQEKRRIWTEYNVEGKFLAQIAHEHGLGIDTVRKYARGYDHEYYGIA
jgi:hypothetical protein